MSENFKPVPQDTGDASAREITTGTAGDTSIDLTSQRDSDLVNQIKSSQSESVVLPNVIIQGDGTPRNGEDTSTTGDRDTGKLNPPMRIPEGIMNLDPVDSKLSQMHLDSKTKETASGMKDAIMHGDFEGLKDIVQKLSDNPERLKAAVDALNKALGENSDLRLSVTSDGSLAMFNAESSTALVVEADGSTSVRPLERTPDGNVVLKDGEVLNQSAKALFHNLGADASSDVSSSNKRFDVPQPDRGDTSIYQNQNTPPRFPPPPPSRDLNDIRNNHTDHTRQN